MEKYGLTVRQIRLNKGFKQKEIYTGLLSKSFSIDFEKGLYDIKFSIMLNILKRLMISIDEFILIHNHYHENLINQTLVEINEKKFENDDHYAQLVNDIIKEESKKSQDPASRVAYWQMLILQSIYSDTDYQHSNHYLHAKQEIQNYLFNIETWTLSELRIFSNMHFLFENNEIKTSLFLTAWKSIEKYQYHPEFLTYITHLLTNHLFSLIYTQQYSLAAKVIERLYELTEDITMMVWKVMLYYLEGLYFYATDEQEKGLQLINKAKLICELTDNENIIKQIEAGLRAIQNDNHISV